LFSIPVYIAILLQSKPGNIKIQLNKKKNLKKIVLPPYLLFILLTITIFIMVFVTKLVSY